MFKLLKYLKNFKMEAILGPLLKLCEASLELLVPLVVAKIIDNGINGALGQTYIVKMCLLLVCLGLLGLVFSVTAQYFAAKAAVGFTSRVRFELFKNIQQLSYAQTDVLGTSTLITRLTSDMNQVQNGLNLTLRLLLRSPFVVFGAMVMAFTVNARLALMFVIAIPVLAIAVFSIMLACIPLYKKVQAHLDGVTLSTRENLNGVRVVRAFCKEKSEEEIFKKKNDLLTNVQVFTGKISALMNPITYVIINLAIVLLIYKGAISVQSGIVTQGAVVALYNYMSQILVELIKLANLIINITRSVACGNRIQSVMEQKNEQKQGTASFEDSDIAVEFYNVSLIYPGNKEPSVEDISFVAKKGETIGLIGATGSGKTSVVNLIPRFYDALEGTIKVFGKNQNEYPLDVLRRHIGVVPQKSELFTGSIRENLVWGNEDATDEEILGAVKIAQAEDVVSAKGGLDALIEQGGRNLSGGQKQRLCIARALVKKPDILILDDSASALDYATDLKLRQALKKLDITVFIVSQRTASVMNADKIAVLDDGKICAMDTHERLLETCPEYREIFTSQTKGADE